MKRSSSPNPDPSESLIYRSRPLPLQGRCWFASIGSGSAADFSGYLGKMPFSVIRGFPDTSWGSRWLRWGRRDAGPCGRPLLGGTLPELPALFRLSPGLHQLL